MNDLKKVDRLAKVFRRFLPHHLELAKELLSLFEQRCQGQPQLTRFIRIYLWDRLAISLRHAASIYQNEASSGYFTTALLTRSMIEAGSIICMLMKHSTYFLAFLEDSIRRSEIQYRQLSALNQESHQLKLRIALKRSTTREIKRLKSQILMLCKIQRSFAEAIGHESPPPAWPRVQERCRELGLYWQVMYEMPYRDLSEAAHAQFNKLMHSPSNALRKKTATVAMLHAHSRALVMALDIFDHVLKEVARTVGINQRAPAFKAFYLHSKKFDSACDKEMKQWSRIAPWQANSPLSEEDLSS